METSDREIVLRVLAGDRQSFDALVRRHSAPVWGTLRASVKNREDAREILQETWTRAFERLGELREPDRLRSWLLSIALNLVRQRFRRPVATSLDACEQDGPPSLPAAGEPVGAELEERETRARVRAEMALLPRRQREVVDLRVNHDLSHAEIAGALGISEANSRANYYQGLKRLKACFDGMEP